MFTQALVIILSFHLLSCHSTNREISSVNNKKRAPFMRWPETGEHIAKYKLIEFPSKTGENYPELAEDRSKMGSIYFQVEKPKGVVFFIYGGGCLHNNLRTTYDFTHKVFQTIVDNNFNILFIDYKDYYNLRKKFSAYKSNWSSFCEIAAKDQVNELVGAMKYFDENLNMERLPLFVYGHSYGGYLVNQIVANKDLTNIRGYISSHGIWNPEKMHSQQVDNVVPGSYKPIDNEPYLNAKTLLLYSTKDTQVPLEAFNPFFEWAKNIDESKYEVIKLTSDAHFFDDLLNHEQPNYLLEILSFLDGLLE